MSYLNLFCNSVLEVEHHVMAVDFRPSMLLCHFEEEIQDCQAPYYFSNCFAFLRNGRCRYYRLAEPKNLQRAGREDAHRYFEQFQTN